MRARLRSSARRSKRVLGREPGPVADDRLTINRQAEGVAAAVKLLLAVA